MAQITLQPNVKMGRMRRMNLAKLEWLDQLLLSASFKLTYYPWVQIGAVNQHKIEQQLLLHRLEATQRPVRQTVNGWYVSV